MPAPPEGSNPAMVRAFFITSDYIMSEAYSQECRKSAYDNY
jgi:hypothetical protein